MPSDEGGELRDWAPSAPTKPQYLQKSGPVYTNNKHKLRAYCVYNNKRESQMKTLNIFYLVIY